MNIVRRLLSILLVVVGTAVVGLGIALTWVQRNVMDTKAVSATTTTVLTDPAVTKLLEREITKRVMSYVVDERFRSNVVGIVNKTVTSDTAVNLVVTGVAESHRALVDGNNPLVQLNLRALAAEVRATIAREAPNLEASLPSADDAFRFTIVKRTELPGLWRWVDDFEGSGVTLVVLGAALAGLGFVLGPSRWALAIVAGAMVLVAGLATLSISHRALREANAQVTDPLAKSAATAIFDILFKSLDSQARNMAVTGGFAVLIGVGVRLIRPEYVRARETW